MHATFGGGDRLVTVTVTALNAIEHNSIALWALVNMMFSALACARNGGTRFSV